MANDLEYEDIQNDDDLVALNMHLRDAMDLARQLATSDVPPTLRKLAISLGTALRDTWLFTRFHTLEDVRKKKAVRRGGAKRGILVFIKAVEKDPKYKNVEFKCIDDYDKCAARRGKKSLLCLLALFICMGRRIIPLVHQVT